MHFKMHFIFTNLCKRLHEKGEYMDKKWWKEAVVYQIYPQSFMDSNGDGIGDIRGIISKLDYLKDLGVDVIWVCPMYKSPKDDNGYDISDYEDISSDFGTMEDFQELLNEVHKREMKLIIDLVINHTSDEHPWFIESKSSRNNNKRDWYIWKEGVNGQEPNNWESIFSGSAWEYDKNTKEYYLHLFSKKQPDLNWENPEVRRELYKMINWWLDKGIDGFRVDAISHIKKEPGFKNMDNPDNLKYVPSFKKHMNVSGIHDFLKELKENTFEKYDIFTVGEANGVKAQDGNLWVGKKEGKFNMVFQFEHLDLWGYSKKFSIRKYKEVLNKWQKALEEDGWNALFIENHDIPRVVSTWGNDEKYWRESATAFGTTYFLQRGTSFIYQGQEIGMTNVKFESLEDYKDIKSVNLYRERIEEGASKEKALEEIRAISRDNARTPMQWNLEKNSGFTEGTPWLPVNKNYKKINVELELEERDSILNFYKKLIKLKKKSHTLIYGKFNLLMEKDEYIFAYERISSRDKYLIISNLSEKENVFSGEEIVEFKNLQLSNYKVEDHIPMKEIKLRPYETRVYKY